MGVVLDNNKNNVSRSKAPFRGSLASFLSTKSDTSTPCSDPTHNKASTSKAPPARGLPTFLSSRSLFSDSLSGAGSTHSAPPLAAIKEQQDQPDNDNNLADQLAILVAKLERRQTRTERKIEADAQVAVQRYQAGKKKDAIEFMRSVHKNKQYGAHISAALFELRGIKIEMDATAHHDDATDDDANVVSSLTKLKNQMRRISAKMSAVGTVVPSDDMLTRKLVRLANKRTTRH